MENDSEAPDWSKTVFLETINPFDMAPDDLAELANDLNPKLAPYFADLAYDDQFGAGTTWVEVLHIWLPNADFVKDAAYTILLEETVRWLRERFKRPGGERRPKSIIIHDEHGREIASLTVETPDSAPKAGGAREQVARRRPRARGRHRGK